jgi:hypothetical protein
MMTKEVGVPRVMTELSDFPSSPSLIGPIRMMQAVVSDDDIVRLNCGGQLFSTQR